MERSAVILFSREQRGCSLGRYFRLRGQPLVSMFGHIGAAAQRCASSPRGAPSLELRLAARCSLAGLRLAVRCTLAGASPGRATRLRRGFAWPRGAPSPELRLAARCALAGLRLAARCSLAGLRLAARCSLAGLRLAARCAPAGASPDRAVRPLARASPGRAVRPLARASPGHAVRPRWSFAWPRGAAPSHGISQRANRPGPCI